MRRDRDERREPDGEGRERRTNQVRWQHSSLNVTKAELTGKTIHETKYYHPEQQQEGYRQGYHRP